MTTSNNIELASEVLHYPEASCQERRVPRSQLFLSGLFIMLLSVLAAPSSAWAGCGGSGERACCLFEEGRGLTGPACDSGLTEVFDCNLGISCGSCAISVCLADTPCGGEDERACCLLEQFPSCDDGLMEDLTTNGVCSEQLGAAKCVCNPAAFGSSLAVCRKKQKLGESCSPLGLIPCADGLDCRPVSVSEWRCFPPADGSEITVDACRAFYVPGFHQIAIDNQRTMSFGTGFSVAAAVNAGAEIGVAYGRDGCYGCYVSMCIGVESDININAYAAVGHFDVNLQCSSDKVCSNDVNTFCSTDTDCTSGATCGTVKVCATDPSKQCAQNSDCSSVGTCFSGGGFCVGSPGLAPCDDHLDCLPGLCLNPNHCLNSTDPLLPPTCSSDSDCGTANLCKDCLSFDGQACVVEAGGSLPIFEFGLGFAETLVNCTGTGVLGDVDRCFPIPKIPPLPLATCDPVGGARAISLGVGVLPIGVGVSDCEAFIAIPVGCVGSDGKLDVTTGQPPVCDAGGAYTVECSGSSATVPMLNNSFDGDGDTITYAWSTDCPGGSFSSTSAANPTLTVTSSSTPLCNNSCNVQLTVSDSTGSNSCTSGVNIGDTTAPAISPAASDKTVECDGSGNTTALAAWLSSNGGASATDSCSSVTWSNNNQGLSDGCGASGFSTVSFTATDGCNRSSITTATFTSTDTTNPVITKQAEDKTVECDGAGNQAEFAQWLASNGGATATDGCGSVTWSNNSTGLSDGCGATGSETVTFTATDDCGNSSTTTAAFTIEDTTAPNISSNAPATIIPPDAPISFAATASDTCCADDPSVVVESFDCYFYNGADKRIDKTNSCEVGINGDTVSILDSGGVSDIVEWTIRATDCCGNSTTKSHILTVVKPDGPK